jgi:hypothetical protein
MSFWNPFCSCQRQTKVSTSNNDFVQHENQLNSNLVRNEIQRIYVRGDGNCLFYALTYGLIEAMKNERNGFGFSVQRRFPLSVELHPKDFADRLRQISVEQLKTKSNFYRQFVATNRKSFDDEVRKFAHDGVCDSALGDIVPLTIANALNVQIIILTSLPHLSRIDVKPMKGQITTGIPFTTIFIAYNQYGLGHYDAAYPRY